jgi:PGF-pre-PGF domain-containing protein
MNEKKLWIAITVALSITFLLAGTSSAATIMVNHTGQQECFAGYSWYNNTIQSALNVASNNDKVVICSGTYAESITVNKAVTLTANNTTRAYDVIVNSAGGDVITVTVNNVNISWLKAQGAGGGYAGIRVNANYVNLSNNWLTSNWYGIYLSSSSNYNTLTNNTANGNGNFGIFLDSSSNNNILTNNNASGNSFGIQLYVSSNYNNLTDNTVSGNSNYGITLHSSSSNTLTGNNASSNSYGIQLYSSSSNTLTNNTASGNSMHGIHLYYSSNNILTGNNASGNSLNGIRFDYSSNNNLTNNNVSGNSNDGIRLSSSSSNTLTGNNVSGNYYGITLDSSSSNTLTGNNIYNSANNGTTITGGSINNLLNYNNIYNNPWNFNLTQAEGVSATYNYWGTTDAGIINAKIYDYYDNPAYGRVNYCSFLDAPYPGGNPQQACSVPAIASWYNGKTQSGAVSITVNVSESVFFNATANQSITNWNWYKDGVNQNWNYNNISLSWSTTGSKTVIVNAANANGTSASVIWSVNVNSVCGNSVCESGESCSSCSQDCGACQSTGGVGGESGGGGGGGSPSSYPPVLEPAATPASHTVIIIINIVKSLGEISPEQSKVVTFEQTDISELKIEVKNTVSGAEITVSRLADKPTEVSTPAGSVAGYMAINAKNISDKNVKSAAIKFKVNRSWIADESIDENSVKLNRYNNSTQNWDALATIKVDEDNISIFYEAQTPGFSFFAITGESAGAALTPAQTSLSTPAVEITTPNAMGTPAQAPSPRVASDYIKIGIILAIAALIAFCFLYMWRKPSVRELREKAAEIRESQTGNPGGWESRKPEKKRI